jgi:glycosyltransferase involved in cell wall biosynthesis
MKFEIIIPTYKRVEKLERLLTSIKKTSGERIGDLNVFIVFDKGDYKGFYRLTKSATIEGLNVMMSVNPRQELVFGIWNNHLQNRFESDAVIVLCDDTEFLGKGVEYVMNDFETHCADTDWVMALNQKDSGHCASFVVIGKKFAERFTSRMCFYPYYKVVAGDNELWAFARSVERAYLNTDEVVIAHNHTQDLTDKEGKSLFANQDRELFKRRVNAGMLWGKNSGGKKSNAS